MEYVEQVFYRKLNASDFKKLYDLDKPESGGGQTYLEAAGIETSDLVEFLKYGEKYENNDDQNRDSFLIHAYSLGAKSKVDSLNSEEENQFLFFDPRHGRKNYRICNQTKVKKHEAWSVDNGFPEPKKNASGQYQSSDDFLGIIDNLCIIIIRTSYKKYYASYINQATKPEDWPSCFAVMFESDNVNRRGIVKIESNSVRFQNSKESPFIEEGGTEHSIVQGDFAVGESFVVNWKQNIFYGVPGCGKSYSIDKRLTELGIATESRESHTKRVVFHPEFTNADFVGQILPTLTDKGVDYKFNAGQFTKILRDAYTHPSESYALIIEEINRGNAASIFGDLFQLLDRLDEDEKDGEYTQGWSSYCVMNDYINAYMRGVYDNKEEENPPIALLIKNANIGIRLPPNLSIFATMNTSDQNVFKLDNAFKRRWELEMIPNEFDFTCDDEEEQKKNFNQCNAPIEGFDDFSWGGFRSAVNAFITDPINGDDTNSFSDKQLGTWFVKAKASEESETGYIISKKIFLNKVIEYLWDDVFTSDFTIFNSDIKTLSRAIEIGNSSIFSSVFVETVKQKSAELGDL